MTLLHMFVVCLVSGALGAHLDLDSEAPPDSAPAGPMPLPDMFTYLLPRLSGQYRPQETWGPLLDQDLYLDANALNDQMPEERFKRAGMSGNGPSLSIINPLDVLRQRLLLEMARRQMRESQKQVAENRKLMKTIGKRGSFLRQPNRL